MYCSCSGKSRTTTTKSGDKQKTCSVCGREKNPNPHTLDGHPVKVGDKLYHLKYGWMTVRKVDAQILKANTDTSPLLYFNIDDPFRTLYWDEVVITPPSRPKKKVAAYRWVYKNAEDSLFITRQHYTTEEQVKRWIDRSFKVVQRIDSTEKMIDEE